MLCEHLQRHKLYLGNYNLFVDGEVKCGECGELPGSNDITDIRKLQAQHRIWVNRNFPDQQSHHGLLGLVEEVGELSHSHLKKEQGIRGSTEEHDLGIRDAVGDIIIYLMSYCNTNNIDAAECLTEAWAQVEARDWQNNKVDGVNA